MKPIIHPIFSFPPKVDSQPNDFSKETNLSEQINIEQPKNSPKSEKSSPSFDLNLEELTATPGQLNPCFNNLFGMRCNIETYAEDSEFLNTNNLKYKEITKRDGGFKRYLLFKLKECDVKNVFE